VRSSRALVALGTAALVGVTAGHASGRGASTCTRIHGEPTRLVLDGYLYAVVRAPGRRFLFGSSGPPVETIPEALHLIRALGFTGTDSELLDTLMKRSTIPGAQYGDGEFYFGCRGVYTVTAVVRQKGRFTTATRFWLQQGVTRVTRAFCMSGQWVPAGARVSVTFRTPLASSAPVFAIDLDGNGKVDRVGPFRPGGARFPISDRC
jgi:hypothetical protein